MDKVLLTTFNIPPGLLYLKYLKIDAVVCDYNPLSEEKVRRILRGRLGNLHLLEYKDILKDVPYYFTPKINSERTLNILKALKPKYIIFCADVILKDIVDRYTVLGIHPSLLPNFRGARPVERAFKEGKPQGISCFILDRGIDTGKVVCQWKIKKATCREIRKEAYITQPEIMKAGIRKLEEER